MEQGGPVLVEGPVEVDLGDGRTAVSDRFVVALCACRRSRSYPWCDTSHRRRSRPRSGTPDDGDEARGRGGTRGEDDVRGSHGARGGHEAATQQTSAAAPDEAGGRAGAASPGVAASPEEPLPEAASSPSEAASRRGAGAGPRPASAADAGPAARPATAADPRPTRGPSPYAVPGASTAAPPTVGVEEEFLLVDEASGRTVPAAGDVLEAAGRPAGLPEGAGAKPELLTSQVEFVSGICGELPALAGQLADGRRTLAAAARSTGRRLLAAGTPVLQGGPAALTEGERYERIGRIYGGLLADYEACGCHVHVGIADEETAVAVVNRLRPWLPTLLALSANSPFHDGRDTGYASWRMVLQSRFPGSGVPPFFPSAAAYRRQLQQLVDCGSLADVRQSFWLARPSPTFPTVEFRVADAATTVDEAVLQAALSRALVSTALREIAAGAEPVRVSEQVAAAAVWSAARHGLDGPGVHPLKERQVPAVELVDELLERLTPALEESGDLESVRRLLRDVVDGGTGARRQRAAVAEGGPAAVARLAELTEKQPETTLPRGAPASPDGRDATTTTTRRNP